MKKRKRLPDHVWARILRIRNGVYQPKVDRKIKNSKKPELKLDWIDTEFEFLEVEEKLLRELE